MSAERERIRGVTEPLPAGEHILWQGSPRWTLLARHALRIRMWMAYFGIIVGAGLVGALRDGVAPAQLAGALTMQLVLSAVVIGGLYAYAAISARSTVYVVTDRRVVLRIGVVVPTTVNIPIRLVESAACRSFTDGTSEIALVVRKPDRLGYFHLWPHVRPWHLRWPEPTLRAIDEPAEVIAILRDLAAHDGDIVSPPVFAGGAAGATHKGPPSVILSPETAAAGRDLAT